MIKEKEMSLECKRSSAWGEPIKTSRFFLEVGFKDEKLDGDEEVAAAVLKQQMRLSIPAEEHSIILFPPLPLSLFLSLFLFFFFFFSFLLQIERYYYHIDNFLLH